MAVQTISYANKSAINVNPDVADTNKVNATDMNEIKSVVNNNATILSGLVGQILWTNPSPTSNFDSQTVNLNESLDNYDTYEVLFNQGTNNQRIMTSGKIPVGHGTILDYITGYPKFRPTSETVSGTSITFEDCKSLKALGGGVVENSSIIPLYIIGYKTGLF
jgi:hypothetical protein